MNFQPDLELVTTNAKIYQMKQKPRPGQAEIGEALGVPQPTVSRAITMITPLLSAVLADYVRPPMNSTRKPSTSWTAHCSPAGHRPGTSRSTREAQDNRNECPGRLHDLPQAHLDFWPSSTEVATIITAWAILTCCGRWSRRIDR